MRDWTDPCMESNLHRADAEVLSHEIATSPRAGTRDLLRRLIEVARAFQSYLRSEYGNGNGLGAGDLPKWSRKDPRRVLCDMYNAVAIHEILVEAGAPKTVVESSTAYTRSLVRKGKRYFQKHYPGWWTGDHEKFFSNWE